MIRQIADQQKISFLIAGVLLLILVSMVGFGSAVVYSMARLQSNIQEAYAHPFAVSNAGLDAHTTLSHLHNQMMQMMLVNKQGINAQQDREISALNRKLRNDFSVIKANFFGDTEKITQMEQQLDDWEKVRMQITGQIRQGHREQALKLAASNGIQSYRQLEVNMGHVVASSQRHVEDLVEQAKTKSSNIVNEVWWFLGGFIITSIFFGIIVIRKISRILEHSKESERRLHESEERMKLALSSADVGTWDLDPVTGKLDFDSQWGGILNYAYEKDRPHNISEWAALIHPDDKERVLKAMQDNIDGKTFEYKAEYRIQAKTGNLRWVVGHGKAVRRDKNGKALRVVGITRDITMQKQAEDTIWKLAHTDSLTGLPNRSLFYDRLGQCIAQANRHQQKLALLFIDLDDFKLVNDKFGHSIGDLLLQTVAERLRQNIRSENTVARTGGDEFICILANIGNTENAVIVAKKIIQSISEAIEINGSICQIGCSIGIAIFPDDSEEIEKLVTQADHAMYKAKGSGKNNYHFFSVKQATL
jgi:diguanylate cyclase (GGDEF)-like protein/PAS domain S-box-containing protein